MSTWTLFYPILFYYIYLFSFFHFLFFTFHVCSRPLILGMLTRPWGFDLWFRTPPPHLFGLKLSIALWIDTVCSKGPTIQVSPDGVQTEVVLRISSGPVGLYGEKMCVIFSRRAPQDCFFLRLSFFRLTGYTRKAAYPDILCRRSFQKGRGLADMWVVRGGWGMTSLKVIKDRHMGTRGRFSAERAWRGKIEVVL